jgi:hypothetical protein
MQDCDLSDSRSERRDAPLDMMSNWLLERRRADRRAVDIGAGTPGHTGDRRAGPDRRRNAYPRVGDLATGRTPITTWLARRLPDDFLLRDGDVAGRIGDVVSQNWPRYDRTARAELVNALSPMLGDLLDRGGAVTQGHRERCEIEIVAWLSRHSPRCEQQIGSLRSCCVG